MNSFFKISTIALLVSIIGAAEAAYQLDLKKSIDRIKTQIQVTKDKPAQWGKLDKIVDEVLECIATIPSPPGNSIFEVQDAKWMPPGLTHFIESLTVETIAEGIKAVDWSVVEAKTSGTTPQDFLDDLKEFMGTENFKKIHDFIWANREFLDLIELFYKAQYPDVYNNIKSFYEEMGQEELAASIPNGPPGSFKNITAHTRTKRDIPQNSGSRLPSIKFNPPSIKQDCSKVDLITFIFQQIQELHNANIHEVIKVFLYIFQEVLGNVAMHVLLLKLGEPQKGAFFHDALTLEEMDEGIVYVQGFVLQNESIGQLNEVLKQVTGLDLGNIELFKYVVNLIQYLVWNIEFPST